MEILLFLIHRLLSWSEYRSISGHWWTNGNIILDRQVPSCAHTRTGFAIGARR